MLNQVGSSPSQSGQRRVKNMREEDQVLFKFVQLN